MSDYKGYRFLEKGGRHLGGESLSTIEDIYNYCQQYRHSYPELVVTDDWDNTVVHVVNGFYQFPPEWAKFNP